MLLPSLATIALLLCGIPVTTPQEPEDPYSGRDAAAYGPSSAWVPQQFDVRAPLSALTEPSSSSTTTAAASPSPSSSATAAASTSPSSSATAAASTSPSSSASTSPSSASDAALNTIAASSEVGSSSAATTVDTFGLPAGLNSSGGGFFAGGPVYGPEPEADRRSFDLGGYGGGGGLASLLTPLAGAAAAALTGGGGLISLPNANIQPTLQKTFVLNMGPHNPPLVVQGNAFQPGASAGSTINNAAPQYAARGRGGGGSRRYPQPAARPAGPPVYAQQRGGHVSYPSSPSLPQVAGKLGIASLLNFAKQSGFLDNLLVGGPFTFFAPSDEAFTKLPKIVLSRAAARPELMKTMLLYHLVPDTITTRHFTNDLLLPTLATSKVRINLYQLGYKKIATVNGAVITRPDQYIINGVIHVIDRVLFPMANTSILGIVNGPNCQPFDVISTVLALAGLYDKLLENGPFTVFLPNTEAFGLIPSEERDRLIQNQTLIREAFLYHIVPGTYYSQGLQDGQWLETLSTFGAPMQVGMVSDGHSRRFDSINGAVRIARADIPATNGVVHIVDKIITPFQTYLTCLDT